MPNLRRAGRALAPAFALSLLAAIACPTSVAATQPSAAGASPPHVLVILEENHSYGDIIGNAQAPYINSLADQYGLATNWTGVSHPSLPNYLALVSGSIWNDPQDTTPQDGTYSGPTLVDELANAGVGWKAYMEDMPRPCDLTDQHSPGSYDVNHNPFVYFTSIRNSPSQCNRVVPFSQLAADLANNVAPPFLWISPNVDHDMHNGTVVQGDTWLRQQLAQVFASVWYSVGATIIVTWDEGESSEQIPAIVVSSSTPHGARLATRGNHFGTLRTLEQLYGVGLLGHSADPASTDLRSLLGSPSGGTPGSGPTSTTSVKATPSTAPTTVSTSSAAPSSTSTPAATAPAGRALGRRSGASGSGWLVTALIAAAAAAAIVGAISLAVLRRRPDRHGAGT